MAQSELDKLLKAFEDKNTSMEFYILMSIDGIPFKSNMEKNSDVVRVAGHIFDLILYSKRTLSDLKKTNDSSDDNLTLRMRLRNGVEIIIVQQNEYYLISKQICKIVDAPPEAEKKQ